MESGVKILLLKQQPTQQRKTLHSQKIIGIREKEEEEGEKKEGGRKKGRKGRKEGRKGRKGRIQKGQMYTHRQ